MLDQVWTTAGSRNQHLVGSKGRVFVYVTTVIDYDQTVGEKGVL